jgi:hypothetical protein
MRTAMAVLSLMILSLLSPARADGGDKVVTLTATNIVIGPETVNLSFNWDVTTESVSGPMNFSTTGPVSFYSSFYGTSGLYDWFNSNGDELQLSNENFANGLVIPQVGVYNPYYFSINCFGDKACFNEMGDGYVTGQTGSFVITEAATPEPGTLLMFLCGIAVLGLLLPFTSLDKPSGSLRRTFSSPD